MLRFLFVSLVLCFLLVESGGPELKFVQALWRHGDRAALVALYPVPEEDWTFGGGGLGEMTPDGMQQLHQLGAVLRKRYVTDGQFLNGRYAARELYVRSTDLNRTIISAMSLLYGMFPPGAWNVQGVDYPNAVDWQQGLNFVPVHVDGRDSCAISQHCDCQRYNDLQAKWADLEEFREVNNRTVALNMRIAALYNVTASPETFNIYMDTWKCQRTHFNDTLYQKLPWYSEELFAETETTWAPYKRFMEGQFENSTLIDGVDIAFETRKLLSGPLLNEIYERAETKLACSGDCDSHLKMLKFYGYSSHDMNIYGLLVVLGMPQLVKTRDGWPDFASALLFEFYSSPNDNSTFFKILYRDNENDDLTYITSSIPVCDGADLCPMEKLKQLANYYKPLPDFETLCNEPLVLTKSANTCQFSIILTISLIVSLFVFV